MYRFLGRETKTSDLLLVFIFGCDGWHSGQSVKMSSKCFNASNYSTQLCVINNRISSWKQILSDEHVDGVHKGLLGNEIYDLIAFLTVYTCGWFSFQEEMLVNIFSQ